jgi:hypothetical protein
MGTIVPQGNRIKRFSNVESKTYNVTNSGTSAYLLTVRDLTNANPKLTFKEEELTHLM